MARGGVIVTDGNERSTLAVTRSLGRRGMPVYVGAETPMSLAGSSRYCTQSFVYPSPWRDPDGYLASILDAVARWDADAMFPMTDIAMEIVGEHQDRIRQSVALPIPKIEQYHQLSDKYQLTAWANDQGIPVPQTLFVSDGRIDGLIDDIHEWPVVVKPGRSLLKMDDAWRKSEVLFARDADDLRRIYYEHWFLQFPSMIQQLIAGQGEGVFGLFRDGDPKVLFAHRRLRERPPSGGVSVFRESIELPEPMTDYATRIMRWAGWNGIAMVEFKVETQSKIPFLMEVNGRFWGSLQLAIDAGVDFPMLLYREAMGEDSHPQANAYDAGTKSRWWLGDVDHLLARLRNPAAERSLAPGASSRGNVILSLMNVFAPRTKNEVFRFSDLAPGILELRKYSSSAVAAVLRKIGNRVRHRRKRISLAKSDQRLRAGLDVQELSGRFLADAKRILVLCKGNICRSPFADKYLAQASAQKKLGLEFVSAGLEAELDKEAYPLARTVARDFGVDLDGHRTQLLSHEMVEAADIILVMEPEQETQLERRFPEARRKMFLLGHFAKEAPSTEIADPYGGTAQDFAECYTFMVSACDGFLSRFE